MNYSAIRAIFCNSGQQSQAELRFYRGVCVLQKFQQSRHGDGRFCFNRGSLHRCCSLYGFHITQYVQYQPYFKTTDYTGGIFQQKGTIKGLFLLLVEKGDLFCLYFPTSLYARLQSEGLSFSEKGCDYPYGQQPQPSHADNLL